MANTISDQDHQLLSRYLDGELPRTEAAALRRRLLAEPALRAHFDRMKTVDASLKQHFAATGADAVPGRVTRLLAAGSGRSGARAGWGLAIAASLLVASGLLLGPDWRETGAGGDPSLAAALEHTPSLHEGWQALEDGRRLRPLLSFAHRDGSWCREYLLADGATGQRAVACRRDGDWHTVIAVDSDLPGAGDAYRPAAAGDVDPVAAYVTKGAADIPLDAAREADLIARGWQ